MTLETTRLLSDEKVSRHYRKGESTAMGGRERVKLTTARDIERGVLGTIVVCISFSICEILGTKGTIGAPGSLKDVSQNGSKNFRPCRDTHKVCLPYGEVDGVVKGETTREGEDAAGV
jgi:hypothetical protein